MRLGKVRSGTFTSVHPSRLVPLGLASLPAFHRYLGGHWQCCSGRQSVAVTLSRVTDRCHTFFLFPQPPSRQSHPALSNDLSPTPLPSSSSFFCDCLLAFSNCPIALFPQSSASWRGFPFRPLPLFFFPTSRIKPELLADQEKREKNPALPHHNPPPTLHLLPPSSFPSLASCFVSGLRRGLFQPRSDLRYLPASFNIRVFHLS